MDYDSLALSLPAAVSAAVAAESEPSMCGGQEQLEVKSKDKTRRYWTPREEEHLFEIWGRDNWRLTRTGKNTIFFALWAEELRDRFSVIVKPEEIQMKVNQTRAKFRSVKKSLQNDAAGHATRWKKFDMIDRILRNLHRPKDAEPLPPEVLKTNRDISPGPERTDTDTPTTEQGVLLNLTTEAANSFYNNNSNSNNSGGNAVANSNSAANFNTELFTDQYDEVKQEYDEDYRSMPFQEQMQQYSPAEPPQLLELQTPQQLQQQQQQQQQQFQQNYGQGVVAFAGQQPQPPQPQYNNNSSQHQPITAVAYINSSNNSISVSTTSSNGTAAGMQPPSSNAAAAAAPMPTPRKRGRPYGSQTSAAGADSLEFMFMEEVRRKNQLLAEQTQISRKRLELEERKVALLSSFFPKCLEQQAQILAHIAQQPQQHQE